MKIHRKGVAPSMAFYFAATLSILSASSGAAQQVGTDLSAAAVPLPKNIVTTTINVGGSPTRLGVTPNGDYVYVANSSSNSVSVISTSTNAVAATIPTGSDSFSVTVSPDGTTVYVGGYVTNSISVISTATNTVTNTISLPSGAWPHALAVTPDGTQLYATDVNNQVLYIVDTSTLAILTTIAISGIPGDICFTADGTLAYVISFSGFIDQIDVASQTIVKTNIGLGTLSSPRAMAINPTNSHLFVANFFRNVVGINTVDWVKVKFHVMPRQRPKTLEWLAALTVTPDGQFLYVVIQNLNQVVMVQTHPHQVVGSPIPMGDNAGPYGLVVAPNGNTLYVANRDAGTVAVVDISQ
jgi:YVTN family beta-propeller protein